MLHKYIVHYNYKQLNIIIFIKLFQFNTGISHIIYLFLYRKYAFTSGEVS